MCWNSVATHAIQFPPACGNGDGPRANINKGLITFDDFSAADCKDPTKVGVVRVDITLPFMFTQVRGTIFARSPQGNEYLAIRDNNVGQVGQPSFFSIFQQCAPSLPHPRTAT